MRAILLAMGALVLASCGEVDLGEVPVLCNAGQPRCPRGYRCEAKDRVEYCVKAGLAPEAQNDGGARPALVGPEHAP